MSTHRCESTPKKEKIMKHLFFNRITQYVSNPISISTSKRMMSRQILEIDEVTTDASKSSTTNGTSISTESQPPLVPVLDRYTHVGTNVGGALVSVRL
jgi:hypothetical protein